MEASIPSPPYIQRELSRESNPSSGSNRNSYQYPNSVNSGGAGSGGGSGSSGASSRHRHSNASSISTGNGIYSPANPANVETQPSVDTPERFVYSSGNIELDLGERLEGFQHPSYGRNGIIRGEVKMKKMSSVKSITLVVRNLSLFSFHIILILVPIIQLEGRVQTVITQAGLLQGHNAVKVLEMTRNVFILNETDKAQGKGRGKDTTSKAFPFEFELPSNVEGTNDPLPPTFRGYFHAMEGSVRYTLKAVANKTGLWPREV
jgi:hypothetical protein